MSHQNDPEATRANIAQTREDLNRSVAAQARRVDVPARVREKLDDVQAVALERAAAAADPAQRAFKRAKENPRTALITAAAATTLALAAGLAVRTRR